MKLKQTLQKIFPKFSIIPLLIICVLQLIVYGVTKVIAANWTHYSPALLIDDYIPFIAVFIIPYVLCYAHWATNLVLSAHTGEKRFKAFSTAVIISQIICGILFLVYPTTINRPEIGHLDGIVGFLMNFIYSSDTPVNLFPSMHCLFSWFCWIAVRNCKNVPKWYQIASFLFGIVVCMSTVAIKQHFFVDIIAGIALAEISWFAMSKLICEQNVNK